MRETERGRGVRFATDANLMRWVQRWKEKASFPAGG